MVVDLVDRLDAAGFAGISAAFHPVFENIDSQGTRLTELAARAEMTHQSMGELVATLERRGYLQRRPDPTDGRARLVCLTPQGQQFLRRALREIREIEASWQRRFDAVGVPDLRFALEAAVSSAESARSSVPGST
jgi:DNA-binding MarR family transcriptional regulator